MEGEAATGLPLSKLEKKRGNSNLDNLDKCRNMWEISIPLPEKNISVSGGASDKGNIRVVSILQFRYKIMLIGFSRVHIYIFSSKIHSQE